MYISQLTSRNKNDFHFRSHCMSCLKTHTWGDGYADAYYQTVVFPNRPCPGCGLSEKDIERAWEGGGISEGIIPNKLARVSTGRLIQVYTSQTEPTIYEVKGVMDDGRLWMEERGVTLEQVGDELDRRATN